jgi:two-component system response regulator (stage 0 sporulation protein F)
VKSRPRRILVVDDDDDLRSSVAMVLEEEGWEVREARHGAEALDLLREWHPSVMMLDWRMPVMDGGEVLTRLDGHPGRPRVVLVTASAYVRELAARHGLRFHVGKPFGVDELLAVLDEAHGAA